MNRETGILWGMELTFVRANDGAPYVRLPEDWPGFNEALSDAVGPLPPIGSPEQSLSTYWIDRALRVTRQMVDSGDGGIVQGGNAASILVRAGQVVAVSDYELFDDEVMTPAEFEAVLQEWRVEVLRVREAESPNIPETYRRVPYPD